MSERLLAMDGLDGEQGQDRALRPERLADYIGQPAVREQMEIFIAAARGRSTSSSARASSKNT